MVRNLGLWFPDGCLRRIVVYRTLVCTASQSNAEGLLGLFAAATAAGSLAFVIANVSFYLLAGYFGTMSFMEFASSVTQYYGSSCNDRDLHWLCRHSANVVRRPVGQNAPRYQNC